jgi:hypothetical protein
MSNPFRHSPADILAQLLVDIKQCDAAADPDPLSPTGWPVRVNGEPTVPDNHITCYDTTPQEDGREMIRGEMFHHFGFQIRVRSTDQLTGWAKADAIHTALTEQVYQEVVTLPLAGGGSAQYNVQNASAKSPLHLGKDAPGSKRSLHTINGLLSVLAL